MNIEDYFKAADEIYVIDTETTGLGGGPRDLVVDIGICSVDLEKGLVKDVYSSVVGYDITDWGDHRTKAWIFENTDLTLDAVAAARPFSNVKKDVIDLLRGKTVTSYNVPFDMDSFLFREPWCLRGIFNVCTDIMKAATDVCKLPSEFYGVSYRFPKLDYAYRTIASGDPAGVGDKQCHRAMSDAKMASYIMIEMYKSGNYRP
ncbi:bifunctional ATP-dependent DNA helicase/DNA polymerase III subunit epsilon [Candidatus Methanoplasma termitum]|uniref:Bifunctional ATP-dependent DNA helicase/DNA polymerase III subunit epsilon n=1 Tax=Candidatus Methanoplasma termitum TaxID=1577791 RepID=A0A0A7LE37_9ARCH|nr:3'-5' exonuclease [Candidatus Methanoplasma termitum]AIZ56557.1 bifunctional ATP-dependent DNA helicase/DNA polymerase III subunit epsilon [Candidatus Methanoplasma termitum]MCL2333804.1 3'-5' exonuclease [Candidatus Methanoplasma sp.]